MVDMIQNPVKRVARKTHTCDWCGERILPKDKYTHYVCIHNGGLQDTKMHPECYEAMQRDFKDDPFEDEFYGGPRGMTETEWEET